MKFTALLHHLTVDLLRESFYSLKRKAAPGVDGVTWQEYESGLENRLVDLHGRVHRGAYRALPSRRECTYRKKMDGNVHWESRQWRTRSSSKPWLPSSTRSTRKTFWDSRMGSARGAASTMRWMRCRMRF